MRLGFYIFLFLSMLLIFSLLTLKFNFPANEDFAFQVEIYINGILIYKKIYNIAKIIIDYFNRPYYYSSKSNKIMKNMLINLVNKITIIKIEILLQIGLYDAAITSIFSGLLWSVLSSLNVLLENHTKKINTRHFDVTAVSNELKLKCNIECIIKIRIGYIIFESLKFIYSLYIRR